LEVISAEEFYKDSNAKQANIKHPKFSSNERQAQDQAYLCER
jgi:hypothetical protein